MVQSAISGQPSLFAVDSARVMRYSESLTFRYCSQGCDLSGLKDGIVLVSVSIRKRNFSVTGLRMFFRSGETMPSISAGELPLKTPSRLLMDLKYIFTTFSPSYLLPSAISM